MFIYAVKDELSGFGYPFVMPSDDLAKRDFTLLCRDSGCNISKCPEDYSLFRLGIWDADTGYITDCEPVKVIGARSCVEVI